MIHLLIINLFFATWSHLLNYAGTLLLYNSRLFERPLHCFSCDRKIALQAIAFGCYNRCRCGQSLLYKPLLLGMLSILIFNWIYLFQNQYFFTTFLFCSCMLINIRTDAETFLLPRLTTIYSVPFFMIASCCNQLPVSFFESLIGVALGYGFLWLVRWGFFVVTGREGLGMGDLELLALIGVFLGPAGAWFSILSGSVFGIGYILLQRAIINKEFCEIAFGPFLIISAFVYMIFQKNIIDCVFFK